MIDKKSTLWEYLMPDLRGLIEDGEEMFEFVEGSLDVVGISDYSFMVFPFAKAYEGFLKVLFLDLGLITEEDYYGDKIRIGRILNPGFLKESGNVFERFCSHKKGGKKMSKYLWQVWTRGRNLIFHYFPNNFRKLSYQEALDLANMIIDAMNKAVTSCRV